MKKIRWATHKSLFGQIASSSCLIGGSAGLIFGVSAGTFKVSYFNLASGDARVASYNTAQTNYNSQNIASQWNMYEKTNNKGEVTIKGIAQPADATVTEKWWHDVHGQNSILLSKERLGIDPEKMGNLVYEERKKLDPKIKEEADMIDQRMRYSTLVIDGATHTALDRSFNQGLYNGLANFTQNYDHDVSKEGEATILKPAQDNTQEFVNIYRAAAAKTRILALAGFNHVTPLNALGERIGKGTIQFADPNIAETGMILMDGDVANNQNIASVLFRSDQPAFLSAISTCMYFYNNLDQYHAGYKDLSVGAYGGTAIPTVVIYLGGFQRGIEFFNEFVLRDALLNEGAIYYMMPTDEEPTNGPEYDPTPAREFFVSNLLPASKYKEEIEEIKKAPTQEKVLTMVDKLYEEYSIKMIKLGGFGTHFSGSFASGDAIGISKQLLNRGASAIIAVAGPQSLDTAQEIMNQKKNCIVIGVDSAMERSDYQKPLANAEFFDKSTDSTGNKSAQASNIIKFSAVKDMTCVSNKMLRLAAQGKHWDVNATKHYESRVEVPSWTKEQEIGETRLEIENLVEPTETSIGTFDIKGVTTAPTVDDLAIVIPTSIVRDEKTYYLKNVSKFDGNYLDKTKIIKLKGTPHPDQKIIFAKNCFNFVDRDKNLQYIDFSDVPSDQIDISAFQHTDTIFSAGITSETSPNFKKGFAKLGACRNADITALLFDHLIQGEETEKYIHPEADPYKSICSFGFKTCGNIENGLISISWDGWAPLIQALRFAKFYLSPNEGAFAQKFATVWLYFVNKYLIEHQELVGTDFAKLVTEQDPDQLFKNLFTYDTNSELNKNYSHTMSILGMMLGGTYMHFRPDLTIDLTGGTAHKPSDTVGMTILDWLKNNMYFIA